MIAELLLVLQVAGSSVVSQPWEVAFGTYLDCAKKKAVDLVPAGESAEITASAALTACSMERAQLHSAIDEHAIQAGKAARLPPERFSSRMYEAADRSARSGLVLFVMNLRSKNASNQ